VATIVLVTARAVVDVSGAFQLAAGLAELGAFAVAAVFTHIRPSHVSNASRSDVLSLCYLATIFAGALVCGRYVAVPA
jgi:hypothetical protein